MKSRAPGPCDLEGKGVLVSRPVGQAEGLCRLVETAGGRSIPFPAIAIEPVEDRESPRQLLGQRWDLILFVSRNAVEQALPLFPRRCLPSRPELAAVGLATAQALTAAGRAPDLVPARRFDSESLLALPQLEDLCGKRVLIVRGKGGRTLLGERLVERGAALAYAEVYRRTLPKADPNPLISRWRQDVQLATATSGEILENLLTLFGGDGRALLLATPLVVVSERTARMARNRGFARVLLAERAADEAILSALCRAVEPPHRG
jgi:uroporphyrinogen-III synthase